MNSLTNIIEAIVFASGEPVPARYIVEKLGVGIKEVNAAVKELKDKYNEDCGITLLTFNGKLQFASNPAYKESVAQVLIPIKEKELTKTILECAAIIAYEQPITKPELEEIRQVNCDYAIHVLMEIGMIAPCGRKDTIGKPILYITTDEFLKRFKLNSIDELPDYDELMAQIAEINDRILDEDAEDANYLYKKDEYVEEEDEAAATSDKPAPRLSEKGLEIPDFVPEDEELITIDDDGDGTDSNK